MRLTELEILRHENEMLRDQVRRGPQIIYHREVEWVVTLMLGGLLAAFLFWVIK